jgi:hypothetical protein
VNRAPLAPAFRRASPDAGLFPAAWIAALPLLLLAGGARAQDIEPRAYANAPVGVNFLVAGYGHAEGGLVSDPTLPIQNADLSTDAVFLAYARVLDVAGRSAKVDVVMPFSWLSGTAEFRGDPVERRVAGFADARMRFSMNLYGAPALTLPEFASYKQDTIVGVSVQVAAPTGQYDGERLVNLGNNRWSLKTEVGMSKAIGHWTLELAAAGLFFTDNDDFFGGQLREQDPVYSVQGGITYGFRNGMWAALNGTYYTGGRTTIDGDRSRDLQKNSLVGLTFAMPIDRRNSVKFYAGTGIVTRAGSDADTISVAWQHRWGGGL